MASDKKIALVTGGNSGIGLELCKQLLQNGNYHVLLAARSVDKGEKAVKDLQFLSLPGSIEMIKLDATDDAVIEAAAKTVEKKFGKLDLLVNNAAYVPSEGTLRSKMQECFNTNATGPAVIGEVFGPLLRNSTAHPARIISITSGAGSLGMRVDMNNPHKAQGIVHYRACKSALNMVHACQLVDFENDDVKVFLYCPGFTESNLGPHNKVENGAKPVAEAVKPLMDIVEGKRDADEGKFLNSDGGEWPW